MIPDPRVDAYIARQADFARPILTHLRALIAREAPQADETVKWGMPSYTYKGQILCGFSAFKAHAAFGFWRGTEVTGEPRREAMGSFGKITALSDLPADAELAAQIATAKALIDSGTKAPRPIKHPKPPVVLPDDLAAALTATSGAMAAWDRFPPSHRREYVEWITGAKREETRARRVAQAAAQIAEGKPQNWKYMEC